MQTDEETYKIYLDTYEIPKCSECDKYLDSFKTESHVTTMGTFWMITAYCPDHTTDRRFLIDIVPAFTGGGIPISLFFKWIDYKSKGLLKIYYVITL